MPAEIAVIATTMPIQSNRFQSNPPAERREADSGWRESQRQQRRSEFWQSLMGADRT